MQNEAEPRPQTCSSFKYAEDTMERELLQNWGGEDPSGETQVRDGRQEDAFHLLILMVNSLNTFVIDLSQIFFCPFSN